MDKSASNLADASGDSGQQRAIKASAYTRIGKADISALSWHQAVSRPSLQKVGEVVTEAPSMSAPQQFGAVYTKSLSRSSSQRSDEVEEADMAMPSVSRTL